MRILMWLGVILLGIVFALFEMLWHQGGALAVGFFVAPLFFGFWIAFGLMVVGALRRGPET